MTQVVRSVKPLATSPIKSGQPLGAILAAMGLEHCIPLVHGAQGCSAFAKVFFIQHFHEPVPLQSTAMEPITTIMGADDNIYAALETLCERNTPRIIVLLSTGLSEAQGSDLGRAVTLFRASHPKHRQVGILTVSTPDFYGSMENGYAALLESVVQQWVPAEPSAGIRSKRVNIFLSHMFTPGDQELIRSYVEAFGLQPVILPDLTQSMDGHLAVGDYSSLTQGGTPLRLMEQLGQSVATFVIGVSLARVAALMEPRGRGVCVRLPHLMTLTQMDEFIQQLHRISGREVPAWIERQRGQLLDAMIDCHGELQGGRIALAAEADLLRGWSDFALSQGMSVVNAVAPVNQPGLAALQVDKVTIGDLEDLADLLDATPADMIFANSHAADLAERLDVPLVRTGFPLYDRLGEFRRTRQGYAGIRDTLFDLGNIMRHRHHHQPVYHSPLKQQFPAVSRAQDAGL
ncbi:nitrogenase iron-molybdenum cofactor biosynthesis protein NifN [Acerihabitans arboris]|uniref:Nitrogenase iron-molybdenum cofactor biosynthesis protein NifN n=1 Tax=Acerihabitans arboris TaxID=2691583 RepID=A0A845SDT2_9GAMM|nr:nitrogenase iron-molybdenum cofactor biosynthesis protein NifN [Acerihabitans arboris]NDL62950.1 nitrogenase iron-molybdenum cofactor biosynthesis protein NifN [Acerihabitans arboris]